MATNKNMITPKDLLYLSDGLEQILVLNKRIATELQMLETEEIVSCMQSVLQQLNKDYHALLKIIEKEVKA